LSGIYNKHLDLTCWVFKLKKRMWA